MKFVNTSNRIIYRSAIGKIEPGRTTIDKYHDLEKTLKAILDICGKDLRIVLNAKEAQMLAKVMDLDDAGTKFDPNTIPAEIRNDPTGIRRLMERERKAQSLENNKTAKANKDAALREAMINGEVEEKPTIKPIGVDRSNEEKGGAPMSGFDAILAENARIAAGQSATPASFKDIADPIGAAAKPEQPSEPEAPAQPDTPTDDAGTPTDDADAPTEDADAPTEETNPENADNADNAKKDVPTEEMNPENAENDAPAPAEPAAPAAPAAKGKGRGKGKGNGKNTKATA